MTHALPVINIIQDNPDTSGFMKNVLREQDYIVQTATTGAGGLSLVARTDPNLVLLDMQLSDISGESVCFEIKNKFPNTQVIMLSNKASVREMVKGLNLGADDYVVMPFETDELLARVKARLRNTTVENEILKVADLSLDPKRIEVQRAGKPITLTPNEFKLLQYLMSNPGIVLTREMILNHIWLYAPDVETRVVDVYMGYLRKKIDAKSKKKLLHSIRGFGYSLREA
jgi:two-component system response regulator MprA